MCSPASFETAYVQRASPTEPCVVALCSSTRNAYVPKTSLVENSISRSSVSFAASAASSTLYVPIRLTRIVRTGLSSTVSTPAIAAAWTMCVAPLASEATSSASRTSPWTNSKFGCVGEVGAAERVAVQVVEGDHLVRVDEALRRGSCR